MDASSRRAFPLDSRTVWVEQQLVHGTLLARENLPLGPGEYSLNNNNSQARHISTPSFGKPRNQADFLPSFHSPTSRRMRASSPNSTMILPHSSHQNPPLQRLQSPTQSQLRHLQENSVSAEERSEFKTIFHQSEKRDPYDTNRRYCVTPGPYLAHDSILETVKTDGKHTVKGALPFGPNCLPINRGEWKTALPTYDVNYDSKYIRPVPKFGSFPKDKRIDIPGNAYSQKNDLHIDGIDTENVNKHGDQEFSPTKSHFRSKSPERSVIEARCNLVRLPILKRKPITKLKFDDSSYRKSQKQTVLNMTPSLMRSEVKDRVFDKLLAIPRAHKAPGLKMSLKNDIHEEN